MAIPRSRSVSLSSDHSHISRVSLLSPPPVIPPPAFVSLSAASEIITTKDGYDAPSDENAQVTPEALALLNGFLDHLLFNVLATAKSTKLSCIRPAISDVLKPRLAREVVSVADSELTEYVGSVGDLDGEPELNGSRQPEGGFDLIRAWKLTRLRCMIYTRLGDLEEEDEDEYIEQDALGECDGFPSRFTASVTVAPTTAVFLTAIIEHIAEQALAVAGEAARTRLSAENSDMFDEQRASPSGQHTRFVLEETDMEKLALNATLGRMWRTWRRRIRPAKLSRTLSRESIRPRAYRRYTFDLSRRDSETAHTCEPDPSSIPLPPSPTVEAQDQTDVQVKEFGTPWLLNDADFEAVTLEAVVAHKVRPRSLMVFSSSSASHKSGSSNSSSPTNASSPQVAKPVRHTRSRSFPNDAYNPSGSLTLDPGTIHQPRTQALEQKHLDTMPERDEPSESVQRETGISVTLAPLESSPSEKQDPKRQEKGYRDLDTAREATVEPSGRVACEGVAISQPDGVEPLELSRSVQQEQRSKAPEAAVKDETSAFQPQEQYSSNYLPHKEGMSATRAGELPEGRLSRQELDTEVSDSTTRQPVIVSPSEAKPPITALSAPNDGTTHTWPKGLAQVPQSPRPSTASRTVSRPAESPTAAFLNRDENEGSQRPPSQPRAASRMSNASQHGHRRSGSIASPGTERAAVQRLSRQTSLSTSSSNYSVSRGSDSFDRRPLTAGAPASPVRGKLKSPIGRPQGDPASPRLRASSETSRMSAGTSDSPGNKSDLDKLIHSDETLHFTLTPKNMRDIEEPEQPARSTTAGLADFLRNTAPREDPKQPKTPPAPFAGAASLPPVAESKSADIPKQKPVVPRPQPIEVAASKNPRMSQLQPRDARPVSGSTSDIVEFLRSTGPALSKNAPQNQGEVAQPLAQRPAQRNFSNTSSEVSGKLAGRDIPESRSPGSRLQARSAASGTGGETSDLIDFIRTGPPTVGAHRIPRAVAPFQDTADSDHSELGSSNNGRDSIQDGRSIANRSHTSFSSNTGLLDSVDRASSQASIVRRTSVPGDAHIETRPSRRHLQARDPYIVDFEEDEEDDDLDELLGTRRPKRKQESLMDFLRSVPGPPGQEESPQSLWGSTALAENPRSGTSLGAPSMRSRLMSKTSLDRIPTLKSSKASLRSFADSSGQSTYSTKVGSERNPGFAGPRSQTMNPTRRQTETGALTGLLKSTGPPPPRAYVAMTGGKVKDSSSSPFSRFFGRRKKVEA